MGSCGRILVSRCRSRYCGVAAKSGSFRFSRWPGGKLAGVPECCGDREGLAVACDVGPAELLAVVVDALLMELEF